MARKRIVLHIGLPKTGSSALQNYFSANADGLAEQGIDYPYRESEVSIAEGNNSGNVVQILFREGYAARYLAETRATLLSGTKIIHQYSAEIFAKLHEIASRSASSTVLLSAEIFSTMHRQEWIELAKLQADFDVSVVGFARDPFDFFLSRWRQGAKMETQLYVLSFAEMLASLGTPSVIEAVDRCVEAGLPITLLNYDTLKKDIVSAFMEAAELTRPHNERRLGGETYNTSLTTSEALVAIRAAAMLRSENFAKTVVRLLQSRPDRPKGTPYYSREAHQKILDMWRGPLTRMNERIIGGPLSLELRDTPSREMSIDPRDLDVLLEAVRLATDGSEADAPWQAGPDKAKLDRHGVPRDFDPRAYLFHNPDVARAGVDPRDHYIRHGRGELRRYSYT